MSAPQKRLAERVCTPPERLAERVSAQLERLAERVPTPPKRLAERVPAPPVLRRALRVALLAAALSLAYILLVSLYRGPGFGIPCPFRAVTGLYCPGCGMFRASDALLRGDVRQAAHYNALSVILFPALIILCFRDAIKYIISAPRGTAGRLELTVCIGLAAAAVLYAAARNIHMFMAPWSA